MRPSAYTALLDAARARPAGARELAQRCELAPQLAAGILASLERMGRMRYVRGAWHPIEETSVLQTVETITPKRETKASAGETTQACRATIPEIPETMTTETGENAIMAKRKKADPSTPRECAACHDAKPLRDFPARTGGYGKICLSCEGNGVPAEPKTKRKLKGATRGGGGAISNLLIPEQRRVAVGVVEGMVQLANDPERMVELSPEHMDRVCEWWTSVRDRVVVS